MTSDDTLAPVQPIPRRRAATASAPAPEVPRVIADFGEPGGLRYQLTRLEPLRYFKARPRPYTEEEVESLGPGLYELQALKLNAQGKWGRHGQPRQYEVGDARSRGNVTGPALETGEQFFARELIRELRDARDRHPPDPYQRGGYGEPAVPAATIAEIERSHRDRIEDLKRDSAERLEAQRSLWAERLESQRTTWKGLEKIYESRIEELLGRVRTLDGELVEARQRRSDPTQDLIASLDLRDRLIERLAPEPESEDVWAQLIKHAPAILEHLGNRNEGGAPNGRPPTPGSSAQPRAELRPGPEEAAQVQAQAAFVGLLQKAYELGLSATDAYQELAPGIGPEALSAVAAIDGDAFLAHVYAAAMQESALREVEGRAWLLDLHGLLLRIRKSQATTPA